MPKCGIKKPLHVLIHNSNLYYTLKQLKEKVIPIIECCSALGTKLPEKPRLQFNHPMKEMLWFMKDTLISKEDTLISKIPTIYINLEKRTTRNANIKKELKKLGIKNINRFNAIENKNGAIGCAFSHIKCLEFAIANDYDYVFICEDDLQIIDIDILKNNLYDFLISSINWDVLLLAGNNMLPYKPINHYCIQVMNCITTTGYIVKKHYYSQLLKNFKDGVLLHMKNPDQKNKYAIDKYWLNLQMVDKWFMLIPPSVVQREDYSDIENKITNFKDYMLNYNKVIKPSLSVC